jgi:hypothetical protein
MSDLASLFPDLPPDILRDFDNAERSYTANAPLAVGGEAAQVTDEQVAAYLRSVGSLRAPLNPAVSGQQPPPTPEFAYNGRPAPDPAASYVEAPDTGDQPPPAPPPPPTHLETAGPERPLPFSPPGPSPTIPEPGPPPPPAAEYLPPPGLAPEPPPAPEAPSRQQGIEQLVSLWDSDPQLRHLVAGYLTTGQPPGPAGPPPPVPAAGPPPTAYPQYPQSQPADLDEYADPALRALYQRNEELAARVDALAQTQRFNEEQQTRQQIAHYEQVVEGVVSKFASDYSIPAGIIQEVRQTAARLGAANSYMNGVHPVTGLPVRPDPAEAVRTALSVAYYATPSARALEEQRVVARAQADQTRKQKLAGVGGSSASVPRNPPAPTDPAGRRDAMTREVGEMLNGSWTGGNNN